MLPRPVVYREDPKYAKCVTLVDVDCVAGDSHDIPHVALLIITMQELLSRKERPTTNAIFELLEEKFPWIQTDDEGKFEASVSVFYVTYHS